MHIDPTEKRIVAACDCERGLTFREIAEKTGLHPADVTKYLTQLEQRILVEPAGEVGGARLFRAVQLSSRTCDVCGKVCASESGVRIHRARAHSPPNTKPPTPKPEEAKLDKAETSPGLAVELRQLLDHLDGVEVMAYEVYLRVRRGFP